MIRDAFKDANRIEGATWGRRQAPRGKLRRHYLHGGPIRHAAAPERRDPLVEEASRRR
jgi:hypothetical protein